MSFLENISKRLAVILYWVAGIAILIMIFLTCADVLLRLAVTVYRNYEWAILSPFRPIPGTYELVSFLGSVGVSLAMAHTTVEKGHVAVSLIVDLFPQRVQAIIETITSLFAFILFGLLTWRSILFAHELRVSGEVSLTLELPFYPFVYGIAFGAAVVCLLLITDISKSIKTVTSS